MVLFAEFVIFLVWYLLKDYFPGVFSDAPVVVLSLVNAVFAWRMSLKAMWTYEPDDDSRRVWRFIMFAMFMLMVGHFLNMVMVFFFRNVNIKPPNISDWLGYIWVPVFLLVALYRKYKLVRTVGKPNMFMAVGQPLALVVFGLMVVLLSPFVAQIFFTIQLRLVSLWMIAFISASLLYSAAILSEIYTGLLSRSWKNIIIAVVSFAIFYVAFFFFLTNNLLAEQQWIFKAVQPIFLQITPIFIALAAYFEIEIIG